MVLEKILEDVVLIQDNEIRPLAEYIRHLRYEYFTVLPINGGTEFMLCCQEVLVHLIRGKMTYTNTEEIEKEVDWGDDDDDDDDV